MDPVLTPEQQAQRDALMQQLNPKGTKPVAPVKPAAPPLAVTPQNGSTIRDFLRGTMQRRENKEGL